jgi:hypothetical protein
MINQMETSASNYQPLEFQEKQKITHQEYSPKKGNKTKKYETF